MKRLVLFSMVMIVLMIVTALPTFADGGFYSGTLDSSLPSMSQRVDDFGCGTTTPGTYYYTTQTIQISASYQGYYDFFNSLDVIVTLYPEGTFDPSNPLANCVVSLDDVEMSFPVASGTYTMVITAYDDGATGTFEFALGYPGVGESSFYEADLLPLGRPNDDANSCAQLDNGGEAGYYFTNEVFIPEASGQYTYYDLYDEEGTVDIWLSIYQGTFDLNAPLSNCIANFDDDGTVYLEAGVTYVLMVSTYDPGFPEGCDCEGGGDYFAFLFISSNAVQVGDCPIPLPAGAVVRSIPNGPATYWAPDLQDGTNFNLPAGQTWYVFGTSGDFSHVWIACQANPVWVLTSEVAP
ncbi:MAG: hypothetical protein U0670_07085 [Anaerolineae bacterium]